MYYVEKNPFNLINVYFCPNPNGGSTGWYKIKAVDFAEQASPYSETVSSDGFIRIQSEDEIACAALNSNSFQFTAYPNPFNPETTISLELPRSSRVEMAIYNIKGQLMETLFDDYCPAGVSRFTWDGKNYPSGLYFYTAKTEIGVSSGKMLLLK